MSFTPPPYPYERLDVLRKLASAHDGGPIECSIGTPIDAPPAAVLDGARQGYRRSGLSDLAGFARLRAPRPSAGCSAASASPSRSNDVAACIGTKEFVGTMAGYLHLRSPERDTVLYPAISYPTYAMGAMLAGFARCPSPCATGDSTSTRSIPMTRRAPWSCGRTRRPIRLGTSTTSSASLPGVATTTCRSRVTSVTRSSRGPSAEDDPRARQ